MSIRHAKIVCTLGPATDDVKAIGALIDAGMDVARLNVSHGTHEEHARRIACLRAEIARARKADRGAAGRHRDAAVDGACSMMARLIEQAARVLVAPSASSSPCSG